MDKTTRLICASADLVEKGKGVRFALPEINEHATGFAVRFNGVVVAYINRCRHVPVELDWEHGEFFDVTQQYLICAVHGAHYEPISGHCILGPCQGKNLHKVAVFEENEQVYINV